MLSLGAAEAFDLVTKQRVHKLTLDLEEQLRRRLPLHRTKNICANIASSLKGRSVASSYF
jgi:hypothetical protein